MMRQIYIYIFAAARTGMHREESSLTSESRIFVGPFPFLSEQFVTSAWPGRRVGKSVSRLKYERCAVQNMTRTRRVIAEIDRRDRSASPFIGAISRGNSQPARANRVVKLFLFLTVSGVYRHLQELQLRDRKNQREHLRHSYDQDKG